MPARGHCQGMPGRTAEASAARSRRSALRVSFDIRASTPENLQEVASHPEASVDAALQRAREHIAAFAKPQAGRGAWAVFATFALWFGTLCLGLSMVGRVPMSTWWGLMLFGFWVVVRAGAYIRAFVLMHDATHNALFKSRRLNYWTGILVGLLNGADAPDYAITHANHHALVGIEEENHRDSEFTTLWTTREWDAWPRGLSKAVARVMCDPLVFFTLLPPVWILACNVSWPHRVSHQSLRTRIMYVTARVIFIPSLYAGVVYLLGAATAANMVPELLAQQFSMSYAMFLFSVEHIFEGAYRVPKAEYNRTAACLLGSSYLSVPWWWRWATLGIEYHHLHHLNARVPCYRLKECEESAPPGLWEAVGIRKLAWRDGFRVLLLSMWDPDQRRYVPFPEWAWLERLLAPQQAQTCEKPTPFKAGPSAVQPYTGTCDVPANAAASTAPSMMDVDWWNVYCL